MCDLCYLPGGRCSFFEAYLVISFLQCSLHGEPYTMFCTTKKAMLCMKCFRDTSAEARRYCVDLDTAYNQGAKKLDRALTVGSKLKNEFFIWLFLLGKDNKIIPYLRRRKIRGK